MIELIIGLLWLLSGLLGSFLVLYFNYYLGGIIITNSAITTGVFMILLGPLNLLVGILFVVGYFFKKIKFPWSNIEILPKDR